MFIKTHFFAKVINIFCENFPKTLKREKNGFIIKISLEILTRISIEPEDDQMLQEMINLGCLDAFFSLYAYAGIHDQHIKGYVKLHLFCLFRNGKPDLYTFVVQNPIFMETLLSSGLPAVRFALNYFICFLCIID